MERLYSQPDVVRNIMSKLSPQSLSSLKQTEKSMSQFLKSTKEVNLYEGLRAIAVMMVYPELFADLGLSNRKLNASISGYMAKKGRSKRARDFRIDIMKDTKNSDKIEVITQSTDNKYNSPKITQLTEFELAKLIAKILSDPDYQMMIYDQNLVDVGIYDVDDGELIQVREKINMIHVMTDILIDMDREELDRYPYLNHLEIKPLVMKTYDRLVKSMYK
jgi:hypothetical protein